jgi:hypothetical protein
METLSLTRQWDTFERIENYNDIIYQKLQVGDRSSTYWQFVNASEQKDYNAGQMLHINFFTSLPASTFTSISARAMPSVPVVVPAPTFSMTPSICIPQTSAIAASAYAQQQTDTTIYVYVSTYNRAHAYKYIFPTNEEFMAYNRGKDAVNFAANQVEFMSILKNA